MKLPQTRTFQLSWTPAAGANHKSQIVQPASGKATDGGGNCSARLASLPVFRRRGDGVADDEIGAQQDFRFGRPAIAEEFEALRAAAESRVEVEITTAAEVAQAQQQALLDALRKRLSRELVVSWKTDPSLVAGAVIRAGDLVIDGSVSGELAQLRQAVVAG